MKIQIEFTNIRPDQDQPKMIVFLQLFIERVEESSLFSSLPTIIVIKIKHGK